MIQWYVFGTGNKVVPIKTGIFAWLRIHAPESRKLTRNEKNAVCFTGHFGTYRFAQVTSRLKPEFHICKQCGKIMFGRIFTSKNGTVRQHCNRECLMADEAYMEQANRKTSEGQIAAKTFTLIGPDKKEYTGRNLCIWTEENQHLFTDDAPESKKPFARRIMNGLVNAAYRGDTYKGWTKVKSTEPLAKQIRHP